MVRLLCASIVVGVLSGFSFLLITGEYINDGEVVVTVIGEHGVHEGDVFVVAGWLVALLAVAVLVLWRPRSRR